LDELQFVDGDTYERARVDIALEQAPRATDDKLPFQSQVA
jgi:hypothetical protein